VVRQLGVGITGKQLLADFGTQRGYVEERGVIEPDLFARDRMPFMFPAIRLHSGWFLSLEDSVPGEPCVGRRCSRFRFYLSSELFSSLLALESGMAPLTEARSPS
jgi:hypothetical protein